MIALNGHPFQPAALQQYVTQATQQIEPGKHNIIVAAVDNDGAQVALIFTHDTDRANLRFAAALAHEWSGNTTFGVSGSISF